MTPATELFLLRAGSIATTTAGTGVIAFGALRDEKSLLNRSLEKYLGDLRTRLAALFIRTDVRVILAGQIAAVYAFVAAAIAFSESRLLLLAAAVVFLPSIVIDALRKRRADKIEQQADVFILALASALRSTPSIGDAFRSLVTVVEEPLRSEIDHATKQIALGATLEDALLALGKRVNSRAFDAALVVVIVAQRVGGDLPAILQRTGAAIRELARLDRAAKSKLQSLRDQLWAIAGAPFLFFWLVNKIQPGYFAPLTTTTIGWITLVVALGLWLSALALGRWILAVKI
jgi:tight adherence protein B